MAVGPPSCELAVDWLLGKTREIRWEGGDRETIRLIKLNYVQYMLRKSQAVVDSLREPFSGAPEGAAPTPAPSPPYTPQLNK